MSVIEILLIVLGSGGALGAAAVGWLVVQSRRDPARLGRLLARSPKLQERMRSGMLESSSPTVRRSMDEAAEHIAGDDDLFLRALSEHPELKDHPRAAEIEAALVALTPEQRARAIRDPHSLAGMLSDRRARPASAGATAKRRAKAKAARKARKGNRR